MLLHAVQVWNTMSGMDFAFLKNAQNTDIIEKFTKINI